MDDKWTRLAIYLGALLWYAFIRRVLVPLILEGNLDWRPREGLFWVASLPLTGIITAVTGVVVLGTFWVVQGFLK